MSKVFRKIRQQFLANKKVTNYLLYAVGEIVLVVIGILIALAINNANVDRKLREKEQIYLAGLQNEFEISRLKLEELIKVNRQNYSGAQTIINYLDHTEYMPTEEEFARLLFSTFASDIAFNANNSLLFEMINSGSLKDIQNAELRKHLTNWVSTLDDIAKQEEELHVQREMVVDMFRSDTQSIRTILDLSGVSTGEMGLTKKPTHQSNLNMLNSTAFENNVLLFLLTSRFTETTHYTPLLNDLNTILDMIEGELDSNT